MSSARRRKRVIVSAVVAISLFSVPNVWAQAADNETDALSTESAPPPPTDVQPFETKQADYIEPAYLRQLSPDNYGALTLLKARVARFPDIYAGLSNRGDKEGPRSAIVHLVSGASIDPDTRAAVDLAVEAGIDVIVDEQKYSTTELTDTLSLIPDIVDTSSLVSWGINPDSNTVDIKLTDSVATKKIEDELQSRFGDRITVEGGAVHSDAQSGRYTDTIRFYGGDYMTESGGGICTNGFTLTNYYNIRYSIFAGHCTHGATGGSSWKTNGTGSWVSMTQTVGSVQFNALLSPNQLDAALLIYSGDNTRYGGRIWYGSSTTSTYVTAAYVDDGCNGCQVWVGGSLSGSKLGHLTGYPSCTIVNDAGVQRRICSVQSVAPEPGVGNLTQGGDSGGPVYTFTGQTGTARATGMISAGNGVTGDMWYTLVSATLSYYTSTLTTTY